MWSRLLVVFLAVGGLSSFVGLSAASERARERRSLPRFRAVVLQPLPGFETSAASGLNDLGEVVGGSGSYMFDSDQATLWDRRGRPIELPDTGDWSEALAINDGGEAVGWQSVRDEARHACAWKDGIHRLLPELPESRTSEAVAINDSGWIVGSCGTGEADEHGHQQPRAALWRDGDTIGLGTLGGAWSRANAVNNMGQIVGESSTGEDADGDGEEDTAAFLWREGEMTRLPAPPDRVETMASDINDRGEIVGGALARVRDSADVAAPPLAWWELTFWSDGKVSSVRKTADSPVMNSSGTVAAWWAGDAQNYFGYLYENGRNAGLRRRLVPRPSGRDWQTNAPRAINERGQIAGWKQRWPDVRSVRAFRLDPLPPTHAKRWGGR